MKILLSSNSYPPFNRRGEAIATEQLAYGLAALGIEVSVMSAPQQISTSTRWINGIQVYDLPGFSPDVIKRLSLVGVSEKAIERKIKARQKDLLNEAKNVIEEVKPDILHTSSVLALSSKIWPLAKKMGIRVVHTLCEHHLLCETQVMFVDGAPCPQICPQCQTHAAQQLKPANSIDALAAVSENILQRHLSHGFFKQIKHQKVIPNATPVNTLPNRVRGRNDPLHIGYMGHVGPGKGVGWLLEQMSQLDGDNWRLALAGNGEANYIEKLKEKYEPPIYRFPGYIPREIFLGATDLLVVPSLIEEPFGMVLIESLAAGVPVIASNRGGIPEVAQHSNGTIFLYDPEKPNDFKFLIERFIRNPGYLDQLRGKCRSTARENFSIEEMSRGFEELYKAVL